MKNIIWPKGIAPVSVVMISLNEAHNMRGVLENLQGWAQEVFLIDSFSRDETVEIALEFGVHVIQRKFNGFGDQWNYALENLPIKSPWSMKLDPDERLTNELKAEITREITANNFDAISFNRRLWFMGSKINVTQELIRVWKTGTCHFSDVAVNEHPIVKGKVKFVSGELEHHDSPNLHHWYDKQNRYSTAEALAIFRGSALSADPKFFGNKLERRMWIKKHLLNLPFRSIIVFIHSYLWLGAWKAGRIGIIWSYLRTTVYRMRSLKLLEMQITGTEIQMPHPPTGTPHPSVRQAKD